MITEMLDSKMKEVSNISFEQEICASMLNVIKGSGKGKSSNLLSCLKNYDHITQEYSKFERKM